MDIGFGLSLQTNDFTMGIAIQRKLKLWRNQNGTIKVLKPSNRCKKDYKRFCNNTKSYRNCLKSLKCYKK